jgi:hypothetical protein
VDTRLEDYRKYLTFFFRLSVGWSSSTFGLIKRGSLKRPTPFGLSILPHMKNRTPDGKIPPLKRDHLLSFLRFDNPLERFGNLFERYRV